MIGIYKITSPTNKVYIGQSSNIEKRFNTYRKYPSIGQRTLYYSLKKYGAENHLFEIVHELPKETAQDVLNNYEQLYMDQYRSCGIPLLNIKEGGTNGAHSEETKRRIAKSNSGKTPSQETRWKLCIASTGLKHTEVSKQKIGAVHKGKTVSPESRKKMSIAHTGKIISTETRAKMSVVRTGREREYSVHDNLRKAVLQFSLGGEFIKEWPSASEAGRGLKIISTNISRVCVKKALTTGGFKWEFNKKYILSKY